MFSNDIDRPPECYAIPSAYVLPKNPVIAHWSYELTQLGYPLTPILRSIRNLKDNAIAPGLKKAMSNLVSSIFNNPKFDFSPYKLQYH